MTQLQGERDLLSRVKNLKNSLRTKTHQEHAERGQRKRERDFALTRLRHAQRKTTDHNETEQRTLNHKGAK